MSYTSLRASAGRLSGRNLVLRWFSDVREEAEARGFNLGRLGAQRQRRLLAGDPRRQYRDRPRNAQSAGIRIGEGGSPRSSVHSNDILYVAKSCPRHWSSY